MDPEAPTARQQAAQVARWVEEFLAPSYGPFGGSKLIEQPDGNGRLVRSGAVALREAAITNPDLQGYVDLVSAVQAVAGDQATLAGLLCARLVRLAADQEAIGLPVAASLDGYQLALRQLRALLAHMATADPDGASLASVAPDHPDWGPVVVKGLRSLAGPSGNLSLDDVDIRAETGPLAWLPGVVVEPQNVPPAWRQAPTPSDRNGPHAVRVLICVEAWHPGPWRDGFSYKVGPKAGLTEFIAMEDQRRRDFVAHVAGLGATLLVCQREMDEEATALLVERGIAVWTDAPESACRRLERALGMRRCSRLDLAHAADLGVAGLARREGRTPGYLLVPSQEGRPTATLAVPAHTTLARDAHTDQMERMLRAAGILLGDPVAVPGAGRWQRACANGLRRAADAAPGKTPLAVAAVARALDLCADDLVRNSGADPLTMSDLASTATGASVHDVAGCVRIAVVAALEAAIQMLRIDGHYRRRESKGAWLRGSPKAVPKSMREMGGDVPPLM